MKAYGASRNSNKTELGRAKSQDYWSRITVMSVVLTWVRSISTSRTCRVWGSSGAEIDRVGEVMMDERTCVVLIKRIR